MQPNPGGEYRTNQIWIKIEIHGANGRVVVARYFVGLVKAE